MPTNYSSGAEANDWGLAMARSVAREISAEMLSDRSNEATWNGRRVVIKCARGATDSIGVTTRMLARLDAIIAALQVGANAFDLVEIDPAAFETVMRFSRSTGHLGNRVGLVRRRELYRLGRSIGTMRTNGRPEPEHRHEESVSIVADGGTLKASETVTEGPGETQVLEVLAAAKVLARRYYALTGKPLGITGEIAEYEACRLLGLTLAPARQAGYDATTIRDGTMVRYQIKGRAFNAGQVAGQRVGSLSLAKEWDEALLVILDETLDPVEIWAATRAALTDILSRPGSRARTERGQIGVGQFRRVARRVWPTA